METNDALKFVKDVLAHSRSNDDSDVDAYFPFTEETCRTIIEDIREHGELKPRAIMQAFDAVLREADFELESGNLQTVSPALARTVLSELVELN